MSDDLHVLPPPQGEASGGVVACGQAWAAKDAAQVQTPWYGSL
ncbi:hypothetical protein [Nonomuraea sp. NPDC049480]